METGELISLLTKLVFERLNQDTEDCAETAKTALVIGCRDSSCTAAALDKLRGYSFEFFNEASYSGKLDSYDRIVVPYMSATSMARLANGIGGTAEEAAILDCVMLGKQVCVCHCQLTDVEGSCNAGYLELLRQYQKKLNSFGIRCGCGDDCFAAPVETKQAAINNSRAALSLTHKKIVTERDLTSAAAGSQVIVSKAKRTIITPLAKDYIRAKKLVVIEE